MTSDLERFYELIAVLESLPAQGRPLREYTGRSAWPRRGVYLFREPGEARSNRPAAGRIVRVGTHAVSKNSRSTLWGRLRAHRGQSNGGGNHRGSIFRSHVGAALLARDGGDSATWGIGSSAHKLVRVAEDAHEKRVSEYIGGMPVLWIDVPDEPSAMSERAFIERNAIALLSNRLAPMDPPSAGWLGRHSPNETIRASALWNLRNTSDRCDPAFLERLSLRIEKMKEGALSAQLSE